MYRMGAQVYGLGADEPTCTRLAPGDATDGYTTEVNAMTGLHNNNQERMTYSYIANTFACKYRLLSWLLCSFEQWGLWALVLTGCKSSKVTLTAQVDTYNYKASRTVLFTIPCR